MDIKLYGQADFYYAVSQQILERLVNKGLITEAQRIKIDELNRKRYMKHIRQLQNWR